MAKSIVMLAGVVFVVVGVLGFFNNPVLGIFQVDGVHNAVHLLSGIVAIAMASMGEASAKTFSKVFGVIYGLVAVLGLVMGTDGKLLGIMTINGADNWLHVVLALLFLYLGFTKSSAASSSSMNMGSM